MANKILVKRGTNLSNAGTPAAGELIYKTDTRALYVGDGSTAATSLTAIAGSGGDGDISTVTAGTGLDGGGSSGNVTLSVDVSDFMSNGSNNRILTATGTDAMNAEANLTFDGSAFNVTGSSRVTGNAGLFQLVGTDHSYIEYFPDGTSAGRKAYIGQGSSANDVFTIANESSDQDIFIKVNDGGSSITGIQIDASNYGRVILPNDNQKLTIGAGYDLNLYNNGSTSYISNSNNFLTIDQGAAAGMQLRNLSSDQDILFSVNDGGSQITALQIDSSDAGSAIFSHDVKVNDNGKLKAGSGNDFTIHHDGTNSYINNYTGHIYFTTEADDKNLVFRTDDGSGGVANYLIMDGGSSIITAHKNIRFDDSIKSMYGASSDLQVYHNGTNSFGADNYTGALIFQQRADDQDIIFKCDDGSGGVTNYLTLDGSAGNLNFNNKALVALGGIYGNGGNITLYNNTYNFKSATSTDLMKLTTTGLGINTTSPADRLHIYESGNATVRIQGAGGQANIRYQNDAQSWYAGITAAEQFYWYSSELGATTNMIHTNGDFYTYYDLLISNNNRALEGRETGGTIRSLIKLNSSNQIEVGSNPAIILKTGGSTRYQIDGSGNHNIYGNTGFSSPMSVQYGAIFNEGGHDSDTRIEGSSDANLVRVDAGSNRVGIGTGTPGYKLDLQGDLGIVGNGDHMIRFTRSGADVVSIEQDSAQLYFYNRTTSKVMFLMSETGSAKLGYNSNPTLELRNTATSAGSGPSLVFGHSQGGNTSVGKIATYLTDGSQASRAGHMRFYTTRSGTEELAMQLTNTKTLTLYQAGDQSDYMDLTVYDNYSEMHLGSGNYLKVLTDHGYFNMGPQNSSWNHLYTDRQGHLFDKNLSSLDGNIQSYSGVDLNLRRSQANTDRLLIQSGRSIFSNNLHVEKGLSVDPKVHSLNSDARYHYNVLSHRDNTSRAGAFIIDTDIARNSNRMSVIHVHGHGYGQHAVIDFKICFYPYSGSNGPDGNAGSVINYSLIDDGNDGRPKFIGINSSGNVAIAIDDYNGGAKYFWHFQVDMYNGTSIVNTPTWSVSNSTTDGFGWIQEHVLKAPIHQTRTGANTYTSLVNGKLLLPASHSADKITMYEGGNEKIGTEGNTLLFTADTHKFNKANGTLLSTITSGNFLLKHSGSTIMKAESTAGGYGAYARLTTTTNSYDLVSLNGHFQIDESGVATRFKILDSTGHTGINEDNPTTELHLGTCPDARTITFDQSGRFNGIGSYFSSNATDSQIWFHLSTGATNGGENVRMKVYADGRLQLVNSDNAGMTLAKATRMGYSSGYKALVLGETSGTYTTAIAYDPSTNASPAFTGDGRELIFRNGVEFTTPNAANNSFHNDVVVLKDGKVGISTASPSYKLDVDGDIRAQNGHVFYGDSTSGVLSTGSWAGDLTSNGWERVAGLSHDGGEFVLVEKNGQVSTLIDGSYFAYEAGSNTGGGFWSSSNSSYAAATGIIASGGTLYVKQADGTNASFYVTGDTTTNGYISSKDASTDLRLRRGTNNDDIIIIEASQTRIIGDAVERARFGSWGIRNNVNGSASSPSYSFVSDTNTGWYRKAADSIGFSAGGTERMYMDSSKLFITGAGVNTFRIQFPNDQRIYDNGSGGLRVGAASHELELYCGGGDPIKFITGGIGGTERVRFDTNGNGHFDADVVAFSSTVSDIRLKENVTTINNALDKVKSLRGVEYDWMATSKKGLHDIGLIAQEVEKVLPELVTEHELCTGEFSDGNEKVFKTVNYDKMVGVLIEAIKEQQVQIDELKNKLGE